MPIDLTFRRNMTKALIDRDPSTVVVYNERATADAAATTVTLTGRVCSLGWRARELAIPGMKGESPIGIADKVLITEYDAGGIESGDTLKATSQNGVITWYRAMKCDSYDYKKEVFIAERQ